jgi:hypothetical protein
VLSLLFMPGRAERTPAAEAAPAVERLRVPRTRSANMKSGGFEIYISIKAQANFELKKTWLDAHNRQDMKALDYMSWALLRGPGH